MLGRSGKSRVKGRKVKDTLKRTFGEKWKDGFELMHKDVMLDEVAAFWSQIVLKRGDERTDVRLRFAKAATKEERKYAWQIRIVWKGIGRTGKGIMKWGFWSEQIEEFHTSPSPSFGTAVIHTTPTHEVGHALGIKHPEVGAGWGDLMGASSPIVTPAVPLPSVAEGYGIRDSEAQVPFELPGVRAWLERQIGKGWKAEFDSPLRV